MFLPPHRFGLAINALFLVAGCISALADEALYRVAIIAIIFLLRLLWTKALIQRAARRALTTYRSARGANIPHSRSNGQDVLDVAVRRP